MKNTLILCFIAFILVACHTQKFSKKTEFATSLSPKNELPGYLGTEYFNWTDSSRIDPTYGTYRAVQIQVWYHGDTHHLFTASFRTAPYMPYMELAKPYLTHWTETDFKLVDSIETKAYLNVEIYKQAHPYPVVFLSPALGSHTSFYTYMIERLVLQGYVVVGVNHKFESLYTINEASEVTMRNLFYHDSLKNLKIPEDITDDGYRAAKGVRQKVLGEDLIFALNQLERVNKTRFKNSLSLEQVGVWGHSIGGAAAIEAARLDERFVAVVNLDGTPSSWALAEGITPPFMFIEDLTDYQNHSGYKKQFDRRQEFCEKVKGDAYRVLIGNTNHSSFYDFNIHEAQNKEEKADALRVLDTTLRYLSDFFKKYLKKEELVIQTVENKELEVFCFE